MRRWTNMEDRLVADLGYDEDYTVEQGTAGRGGTCCGGKSVVAEFAAAALGPTLDARVSIPTYDGGGLRTELRWFHSREAGSFVNARQYIDWETDGR